MARLVSLSGKVSQVSHRSMTHAALVQQRPDRPEPAFSFRVNDRLACFRGRPGVGEGDLVTIAGLEVGGVLKALAIRNRSTGVDYGGATALQYLALGLAILVGLLTVRRGGVGLVFLAAGGWIWSRVRRYSQALTLVRAATPNRQARRA